MAMMNDNERARLLVLVSRDEMDFIDKIGKDSMFSTGHKLTHSDIISVILDVVGTLAVTGKNIHSKEELKEYILKTIREGLKHEKL